MSLPEKVWITEEEDTSNGEKFLTVVSEESRTDYAGDLIGEYRLVRKGVLKVDLDVNWKKGK